MLDQLADAGCLWPLFTGGGSSPARFLDIYIYAKKKGFLIALHQRDAHHAEWPTPWRRGARSRSDHALRTDPRDPRTADRHPRSCDKCLRGIELLLERKLPLALKSVA